MSSFRISNAVASAPRRLREAVPQHGNQAVGRNAGQVFFIDRSEPGADQCGYLAAVGALVRIDQVQRLLAQVLWHLCHRCFSNTL
jgi:hypothetical protein